MYMKKTYMNELHRTATARRKQPSTDSLGTAVVVPLGHGERKCRSQCRTAQSMDDFTAERGRRDRALP
jgi:hypothetical protein